MNTEFPLTEYALTEYAVRAAENRGTAHEKRAEHAAQGILKEDVSYEYEGYRIRVFFMENRSMKQCIRNLLERGGTEICLSAAVRESDGTRNGGVNSS